MSDINQQQIKQAIDGFLLQLYHKKADKELKQLAKAQEQGDAIKASELLAVLEPIKSKFSKANWLMDAQAKAKQLKFGTHISKGIHPNAKGDSIRFVADSPLPAGYAGTPTLKNPSLDANGNAAALPLAAFFDHFVDDDHTITMRELILGRHPALSGCFADDLALSDSYQQVFFDCLNNTPDNPSAHEYNKQLLWAINETGNDISYHIIVPLHPSSLTHAVYQTINTQRYSDANKTARSNRHKKTAEQSSYIDIKDLAVLQLGGTKPQNVSQLTSKQGGRTYLLPSMPPKFTASASVNFSKSASNLFDTKSFNYHLHEPIRALSKNIANKINNVSVRDRRDELIDEILMVIFELVKNIQEHRPAGWSDGYQLSPAQKRWLDPKNPKHAPPDDDAESDTDFDTQEQADDWQAQIVQDFAHWLQNRLKRQLKDHAHQFGESEHQAWATYITDAIAHSKRLAQGVF